MGAIVMKQLEVSEVMGIIVMKQLEVSEVMGVPLVVMDWMFHERSQQLGIHDRG